MRQIGTLSNEQDAERFAAYLVTQGIDSHAEPNTDDWGIWVRDENAVEPAREAFAQFRLDPQDRRYRGVERQAEIVRREAVQQRMAAQKNVIEMRGQWKSSITQRAPLTMTMIALAVLVSLLGGFGRAKKGIGATINEELSFVTLEDYRKAGDSPLASLTKGELWRAVTPIFIHLDLMHLAFNMIMFYQFGRLVESLHSTVIFALGILAIAIISNVAQGIAPQELGGSPFFGGMSGVVYGLFGYAWMRSKFDPQPGFFLSPMTVIILMGWLFLCMTGAVGNVANVAHVTGLLVGGVCGFLAAQGRT